MLQPKIVKFTGPPAPWMKDPEIISAKNHLGNLPNLLFYEKLLAPRIREKYGRRLIVYLIYQRIEIKHDPGDLNQYCTELASTLTKKENIAFDQLLLAKSYQN